MNLTPEFWALTEQALVGAVAIAGAATVVALILRAKNGGRWR